MIYFEEHQHTGYALRTRDNAMLSDGTIAFAVDFKSRGMILTHKCCYGAGKPFIRVDLNEYEVMTERDALGIAEQLMEHNIKVLNIAGNSMPRLRSKYTQDAINAKVADSMNRIVEHWPIDSVRTGGQSGADISGTFWAESVGIPSVVLAPKGWMWRGEDGRDYLGEHGFIKRFGEKYDMSDFI